MEKEVGEATNLLIPKKRRGKERRHSIKSLVLRDNQCGEGGKKESFVRWRLLKKNVRENSTPEESKKV